MGKSTGGDRLQVDAQVRGRGLAKRGAERGVRAGVVDRAGSGVEVLALLQATIPSRESELLTCKRDSYK